MYFVFSIEAYLSFLVTCLCVVYFSRGWVHGVVVWMDFHLNKELTISTGLVSPPPPPRQSQCKLQWDPYTKQAVHLLRTPIKVDNSKEGQKWRLRYKIVFRPSSGDFEFEFQVINNVKVNSKNPSELVAACDK